MRKLIAGNWKMNGLRDSQSILADIVSRLQTAPDHADALICPPNTLIAAFADQVGAGRLMIGGQNCHSSESGAHTGDISARMLKDAGASHVILGHSERRADHRERNEDVAAKALAASFAGLVPIVCIGESLDEREAGQTSDVVLGQLAASVTDDFAAQRFVVAYEPIWAIGTGLTPSLEQVAQVHADIRQALISRFAAQGAQTPILYGGSMKPGNAQDLLAVENVDGGLIGGASLKATDFLAIYHAAGQNSET